MTEVAALLKLNQQTIRDWIDAESMPAIRIGPWARIKRLDLNAFLETGTNGAVLAHPRQEGPTAANLWNGQPVGGSVVPAPGGAG